MKTKPSSTRHGLLAGGCWIVDHVKLIDALPHPEHLVNIRAQHLGAGGAPYNVLLNLAQSGVRFPLYGAGWLVKTMRELLFSPIARSIRSTSSTLVLPPRRRRPSPM